MRRLSIVPDVQIAVEPRAKIAAPEQSSVQGGSNLILPSVRGNEGAFVAWTRMVDLRRMEEVTRGLMEFLGNNQKLRIVFRKVQIANAPPLPLPFIEVFRLAVGR